MAQANLSKANLTTAQKIWSDPNCLLMIFAGGSAEFAVHPNVDWLFFTGKLPADPIERFFSTIDYLRTMLAVPADQRESLAKALRGLHHEIEQRRRSRIPDLAYRDVLSMDIYYSIIAADLVFKRKLKPEERDEVVAEMVMFGDQMGIPDLPKSFAELCEMRTDRFDQYAQSEFTGQLLKSYRRALGFIGYHSLLATYPLLLETKLWAKLEQKRPMLSPIIKYTLRPLCRTKLIRLAYWIGLPKRLNSVVRTWQTSCTEPTAIVHTSHPSESGA
jgi:hypothetical protein